VPLSRPGVEILGSLEPKDVTSRVELANSLTMSAFPLNHVLKHASLFGFVFWLTFVGVSMAESPESTSKVSYNRHIRPILSDKCFQCHGPDARAEE